jgi:hypothetical protein
MSKEAEKMLYDVSYFEELMKIVFSDAIEAYDALMKYENDIKYVIALNYLSMAQQSYVELKRIKHESELHHYEVEIFFTAYEEYKLQLKEVITKRDSNTSWLAGSHERLLESWKSTNEFLVSYIKTNSKHR